MKKTFGLLILVLILVLSGCRSIAQASFTTGEKAAITAAKEVEKVILNPGHMEIKKIYYKESTNDGVNKFEEVRMSVSGVSRGGAPVITEFHVTINKGKSSVNHKFTDLEIFAAGADGAYMTVMNQLAFGPDEESLEKNWEKIDAEKINSKFRN